MDKIEFYVRINNEHLTPVIYHEMIKNPVGGFAHLYVKADSYMFSIDNSYEIPLLPFPKCDLCMACGECMYEFKDKYQYFVPMFCPWTKCSMASPKSDLPDNIDIYYSVVSAYEKYKRELFDADEKLAMTLTAEESTPSTVVPSEDTTIENVDHVSESESEDDEDPDGWYEAIELDERPFFSQSQEETIQVPSNNSQEHSSPYEVDPETPASPILLGKRKPEFCSPSPKRTSQPGRKLVKKTV